MKGKPFQPWLSSQDSVTKWAAQLWSWLQASFEKKDSTCSNRYFVIHPFSFWIFFDNQTTKILSILFAHYCGTNWKKEKFFETCQRTSDFCRVVFFVTPRLCGLFPNASVNETTQSVSRFHPCLHPTAYCACRSQAGVRGRHSYNYLRTEKLYCSLCWRQDKFQKPRWISKFLT